MSLNLSEWPAEVIPYMHSRIIDIAIHARTVTDCVMIPSPNPKAHVRFDISGSLHSVGEDGSGFSYATDFFGRNDQARKMWPGLTSISEIGGLGIYFDSRLGGEKTILYHIDDRIERGSRIMWVCPDQSKREYIYYHRDPIAFLQALATGFAGMESW